MEGGLNQELVEYLRTLISTPDGTALVIGDLTQWDWDEARGWEDASLFGILAVGTPTEEQTEELYRLLRPGAHLLLVAPDTQPTGHTGACCLEDGGFEIRDSILLVEGESRLHYVPKVTGKERNEGYWRTKGARNQHPTLKSVALMKRLLADVPPGEVLDPFMGSGSTGLACVETGHSFTGHEREEEYLEVADSRLQQHIQKDIAWGGATIESDFVPPEKSKEPVDPMDWFDDLEDE